MHAYEDIVCPICGFAQPLKNRQDVMQQHRGAGDVPLQNQQPMHNGPPQGWGGGPPGAPPGKHQGMEYR